MNKFSLVLTTYKRANGLIPFIKKYESYGDINEIIVIDDCSEDYEILSKESWNQKVKIYTNEKNLGVYLNKLKALSKSKNDRVLLFDSDNFFDEEYLKILKNECYRDNFDEDIVYCASKANPHFDYSHLCNVTIDKVNWNIIHSKERAFINTGNQLHSRKSINCLLENLKQDDTAPFALDCKYVNYILIKNNFKLKCVENLVYEHPISTDSIYLLTAKDSVDFENSFNWHIE